MAAVPEGTIIGPVSEVHVVKILDRSCNSINANPEHSTYVVKCREEKRFVSEIHDHKQELRSSNELLANLHESGRNEEGIVTKKPRRKLVQALSFLRQERPYSEEEPYE